MTIPWNEILSSSTIDLMMKTSEALAKRPNLSSLWMIESPILKDNALSDYLENDALNPMYTILPYPEDSFKLEAIELDSTSDTSINKTNEEFMMYLKNQEEDFVISLIRADFEDGYNNEVLNFIDKCIKENRYVTFVWLYQVYSRHKSDYRVLAGVLRIIESKSTVDDMDTFYPMVELGLKNTNPMCQEAAIMTIETWRNKQCLQLLESIKLSSPVMQQYANIVITELKQEVA